MSIIVSRRTLAETVDFMNGLGRAVTIQEIADHYHVGYNRAAEITRFGTRHGWFTSSWRHGRTTYYPTGSRPVEPNVGATVMVQPPASTPISFGVEAEMDFIVCNYGRPSAPDGEYDRDEDHCRFVATGELHSDSSAHISGWSNRMDGTCGAEIVSPVWTTIPEAMRSTERQWNYWLDQNEETDHEAVPFLIGSNREGGRGHRSIGQHIHIGSPTRTLTRTEKFKIANYALMEYPLIIAITANSPSHGYSSYRIGHINGTESHGDGRFARPMSELRHAMSSPARGAGHEPHYEEISDSMGHGTVEFRAQDACIPQATLLSCFLLQKLAEKAISGSFSLNDTDPIESDETWNEYSNRRERACEEGGPNTDDRKKYIDELTDKIGNVSLDDMPTSFREILFLGLAKGVWPGMLFEKLTEDDMRLKYEYFHRMIQSPKNYVSNLLEMNIAENQKEWLRGLAEDATTAHRLADLKDYMAPSMLDEIPDPAPPEPDPIITGTLRPAPAAQQAQAEARQGETVVAEPRIQPFAIPEGRTQDYFDGSPENGWFRLMACNEEQQEAARILIDGEISIEGRTMSVEEMRRSPDTFMVHVSGGEVDDVWAFVTRRRHQHINTSVIDRVRVITAASDSRAPEEHDEGPTTIGNLSRRMERAREIYPMVLHGLGRSYFTNGPAVHCSTCRRAFLSHDAHIEYAVIHGSIDPAQLRSRTDSTEQSDPEPEDEGRSDAAQQHGEA